MRKKAVRRGIGLVVFCILLTSWGMAAMAATSSYTVQPGDSFWKIAQKHQTTVMYLKQLNNYWSNMLYVGQRLQVPAIPPTGSKMYTVQPGDSLWIISQKMNTTVSALQQANSLSSTTVYIGQRLIIPTSGGSGSVDPTPPEMDHTYTHSDLNLLARLIYAESRGESYLGQLAVGAVIMNRVKSPDFPNTIEGVIYQKYAFETVDDGQINLQPNAIAYKAAQAAINGEDPTNGALFFYNPDKVHNPNNWIWTRTVTLRIGNHHFAI